MSASSYRSGEFRWPGRTLIQTGQADKAGTILTGHAVQYSIVDRSGQRWCGTSKLLKGIVKRFGAQKRGICLEGASAAKKLEYPGSLSSSIIL